MCIRDRKKDKKRDADDSAEDEPDTKKTKVDEVRQSR